MPDPNPHSRRVKSSASPDYSDLDGLFEKMEEKDTKAKEYQDVAEENIALANQELAAKASLLLKTNIIAFVKKRCEEKGIHPENIMFVVDDTANLRHRSMFLVGPIENPYVMQRIAYALAEIGIPINNTKKILMYVNAQIGMDKTEQTVPVENMHITIDQQTIQGLIEKAVEDRFQPIREKYERAAQTSSREEFMEVGRLIEKETGIETIEESPDEILDDGTPKKPKSFTEAAQARVKDDIRRKVTDELLGELGREIPDSGIGL